MNTKPIQVHPKTVMLWRLGRSILIYPRCAEVLDVLRCSVLIPLRCNERGMHVTRCRLPLFWLDGFYGRRVLFCQSGLEPVVRLLLERAGYQVRTESDEDIGRKLPTPNRQWMSQFKRPDRPVLEFIHTHQNGLIRISSDSVKPARLIAQIHKSWPDQKLAVVAACRDTGKQLAKELRRLRCRVSLISSRHNPAEVERLVVTTFTGLAHTAQYKGEQYDCFDCNWLDLVVVLNANEAVGKKPMECLSSLRRARLYGLVDSRVESAPLERDWMASIFGFQQIAIVEHGSGLRPVEVIQYPIVGGSRPTAGKDLVLLKRQGLWEHGLRNRKIIQLACLLRTQDCRRLKQVFPAVARAIQSRPLARIAILVENIEHAVALSAGLPDWEIVTGPTVFREGLPADVQTLVVPNSWRTEPPNYTIVTFEGLKCTNLPQWDAVIRADGGTGLPHLPQSQLRQTARKQTQPLLLIDFNDRHHRQLRRWSRQRRDAYDLADWHPAGVDPLQARLRRFLKTRSKEVNQ